ncbi:MAG: ABC transporter ATP-binding protein [Candidatus Melainabacteria bacterium]|nr:ABC transporter ATP-binding protein [Candidatus Melainabacteria bacterium]
MQNTPSKLISFGKKYWVAFSIAFISMIIAGFIALLPPWLVKIAVDGLSMEDKHGRLFLFPQQLKALLGSPSTSIHVDELLALVPVLIIIAYTLTGIFRFLHQFFIKYVGIATVRDIRNKLHDHLQKLALTQVTQETSGTYVSRVTNDLFAIQTWVADAFTTLFNDSAKAIFLAMWLVCINWKLTLVTAVVIPIIAFPIAKLTKQIRSLGKRGQENIGDIGGFVQESLQSLKVTQAYNLEQNRNSKFKALNSKLFNTLKKTILIEALISPITGIIGACGIAIIFGYGMKSVAINEITLGDFSSYFLTTVLIYEPMKKLSKVWSLLQQAFGASDRIFELLELTPQIESKESKAHLKNIKGEIEFKNVSFNYRENDDVLENINLKIHTGEKVALVGPSGVGKSTLVSLIPRFYDPQSGKVEIDNIDIKTINVESLRSQIALVTQEGILYNTTIKDNILFGKPDATDEEIYSAAKKAHVIEFVDKFQEGFETPVGENGLNLSGGQRQRIALARAFLKNAPILILDKPTSHLDSESEEYVKEAINELVKNRTVIIIAHRQSTIEKVDKVIYLGNGKIEKIIKQKELKEDFKQLAL